MKLIKNILYNRSLRSNGFDKEEIEILYKFFDTNNISRFEYENTYLYKLLRLCRSHNIKYSLSTDYTFIVSNNRIILDIFYKNCLIKIRTHYNELTVSEYNGNNSTYLDQFRLRSPLSSITPLISDLENIIKYYHKYITDSKTYYKKRLDFIKMIDNELERFIDYSEIRKEVFNMSDDGKVDIHYSIKTHSSNIKDLLTDIKILCINTDLNYYLSYYSKNIYYDINKECILSDGDITCNIYGYKKPNAIIEQNDEFKIQFKIQP